MEQLDAWAALPWCLLPWLVAEILFVGVIAVFLAPRMNRLEPPAEYPIEGKQLMFKIFETVDWLIAQEDADTTFESFLSGWFIGAKCSELKRGNMQVFLAWAMFAKEWSTTTASERRDIGDIVKIIEERLGRKLDPGFNPEVASIRHTLDPVVPYAHRPLALYAVLGISRFLVRVGLYLWGFERKLAPCGTFFYWFRSAPPPSPSPSCRALSRKAAAVAATMTTVTAATGASRGEKVGGGAWAEAGPVVLFHGVGAGLPFYVLAIWKICRSRTSVIVESPSIAMSLSLLRGHRPPSESQLVGSVEGIMESHGLRSAAFFGHSFGSIQVAWMAGRKPHLVSQIMLLDPVCLLLFLPNVARSFLFPDKTGMPLLERLMLYIVTQEKGISHTLRRHFWWYANVMWPEDIKCPIVVGLAGMDRIVPSKPLRRYLLSYGAFGTDASSPARVNTSSGDVIIKGDGGGYSDGVSGSVASSSVEGRSRNGGTGTRYARVAAVAAVPGGVGGGGFAMINGTSRCKVHTCNAGNKCADSHGTAVTNGSGASRSPGPSHGDSRAPTSANGTTRIAAKPDAYRSKAGAPALAPAPSGVGARRVELVYWSSAGHGNVLGDPRAFDEFVRVATRQELAFLAN